MFLFKSSDVTFIEMMKEAKTHLLTGDIEKTKEKLAEAIEFKPSPSLKQFIAVQEMVVRFTKEDMEGFYRKHKKFFSQAHKFLDMDVDFQAEEDEKKRLSFAQRAYSLVSNKSQ